MSYPTTDEHPEAVKNRTSPPQVTIPDDAWRAVHEPDEDDPADRTDERAKLLATLVINGQHFHLDAWQVDDNGEALTDPDSFDHLYGAADPGGPLDTLTIAGREYVVAATPYS